MGLPKVSSVKMGLPQVQRTRLFGSSGRLLLAVAALALLLAGVFSWLCFCDESIPFLPGHRGAEWIVYPLPFNAAPRDQTPVAVVFRCQFELKTPPANALLALCAFRSFGVQVNGHEAAKTSQTGRNWKDLSSADIAGLLHAGTNEIVVTVTNACGPPALWLRVNNLLSTDDRWHASLNGAAGQHARLASRPLEIPPGNPLFGSENLVNSLGRTWPFLVGLLAVLLAFSFLSRPIHRWLRSERALYLVLAAVLIFRCALFLNNAVQMPASMGFDASAHLDYVRFIEEKRALPFADQGWEMFQPPLYYASAAMLAPAGHAAVIGRALNGVAGLANCWVALLCLRLLFPNRFCAQLAGLLIAALLPPALFLSGYITNEPFAAFLTTLAFYFFLRCLRDDAGPAMSAALGLCLGAALLAKSSALLALVCLEAAWALRLLLAGNFSARKWLCGPGLAAVCCIAICGWYYARVMARFGTPLAGNWDAAAGFGWWQDPGYRTGAFFLHAGGFLASPIFAGARSFWGGLYSTLWGDGLLSGAARISFRPPWNYDLQNAGYILAIGLTFLLAIGFIYALARALGLRSYWGPKQPVPKSQIGDEPCQPLGCAGEDAPRVQAEWFAVLAMVSASGFAIACMSLRVPSYGQVKAFYGLGALVPLAALIAAGYDALLAGRHWPSGWPGRLARNFPGVLVLAWALTEAGAFWVRPSNPATRLVQGIALADRGRLPEAVRALTDAEQADPSLPQVHDELGFALQSQGALDSALVQFLEAARAQPDDAEAHARAGMILAALRRPAEAEEQFRALMRINPGDAPAHDNLGMALASQGKLGPALEQFHEAIAINPRYAEARSNLGVVLVRAGEIDEAIPQLREALRIQPGDQQAQKCLEQALSQKAAQRGR